jgi:hypothetical protein
MLSDILITDLRGDAPRKYRAMTVPLRYGPEQPYLNLRRATPPGKDALYHVRFAYDDTSSNEIVVLRRGERHLVACGAMQFAASDGLLDFLDSAWAMDIVASLRSYDPDEFANGLACRDKSGDALSAELCDQLMKPEVFGFVVPQLRLLLRPTPGAPQHTGPSLVGCDLAGQPQAELVRKRLIEYLRTAHSPYQPDRPYRDLEHGAVCSLLYRLADDRDREAVAELVASSLGPNHRRRELLDLDRRFACLPPLPGPPGRCGNQTEEEAKRGGQLESERISAEIQAWLKYRAELAAMSPDDRLRHVVGVWDEFLDSHWERFVDLTQDNLRIECWSRIAALGKEVMPLAKVRQEEALHPMHRAIWHAVLVELGEKIDLHLVAQLISAGERSSLHMAKLILRAGNVPDIDERFPELKPVACWAFDGCAMR